MTEDSISHYRHFLLDGITATEDFSPPRLGGRIADIPARDRSSHGIALKQQIQEINNIVREAPDSKRELGIQVEFRSFPGIELAFESLSRERSGIELLNVRHQEDMTLATVFVPDGKLQHFEKAIEDYLAEKRDKIGRARDNRRLIDAIQSIRAATVRALWTDDDEFPAEESSDCWWEIWIRLPSGADQTEVVDRVRECAVELNIHVAEGQVYFPERAVLLVRASVGQLESSALFLNQIAELRKAKETAEFFDSMSPSEQAEWLDDLLLRTSFARYDEDVPHICLFDTGVNRSHPLISRSLAADDLHTVNPAWGTDDVHGHGTEMAGLALVGDLSKVLIDNLALEIQHRLESVKLIPRDGATGTDPDHHGFLTEEATARAEVTAPFRRRILGLAITARDNRDRGASSAWSATIDSLAADASDFGDSRRLFVLAAGNSNSNGWSEYPASNDSDGIHDPGQAWNALTVGAATSLVTITEEDAHDFRPIAPSGGLSPYSTTSLTWPRHLPLKPDLVLEGGNTAKDSLSPLPMASLSLLTTHNRPAERLFTTTNATSAATALAARMAVQIMAEYPQFWPETVRALMVHSAEWTDAMKRTYLPDKPSKRHYQDLIRRCGFGVPDISRALWTAGNSLTMVVQSTMQPFKKEKGKPPTNREMQTHELPWPIEALEALGETEVEMRVTLSYFIEPNPSRRGRSRYRYESHGLRFDVRRPLESPAKFRERINAAARDDDYTAQGSGDDPLWLIGKQGRHRGSLHSDIWRGSAADLASRGYIAVYPSSGWWRTRAVLGRFNQEARYSLVISIRSEEAEVDLYSEVENQIAVPIEPEV